MYVCTGADPRFSFRGVQKVMCQHAHVRVAEPNSLSAGKH